MKDTSLEKVIFLYIAQVDPILGVEEPMIENTLNQWCVKNLEHLFEILQPGKCNLNVKNCKFVLDQKDDQEVASFFSKLDPSILETFYVNALANGYYTEEPYIKNFELLEHELKKETYVRI